MHLDTALVCALIGAVGGWFVPLLIARIPEPEPAPEDEAPSALDEAAPEKATYADLAAAPGLAWKSAIASAVAAGVIGAALGWVWPLTFLVFLCPVGVALAYIDFRTWLLPTKVIHPALAVVAVLVVLSAVATTDWDALLRAGLGLVLARALYVVLAMIGSGMGGGDVRLATLLGPALGYLGWAELLIGLYAGFVIGVVAWPVLRLARFTTSKHFPFGPFILVGALVGAVWPDLLELVGLAS